MGAESQFSRKFTPNHDNLVYKFRWKEGDMCEPVRIVVILRPLRGDRMTLSSFITMICTSE